MRLNGKWFILIVFVCFGAEAKCPFVPYQASGLIVAEGLDPSNTRISLFVDGHDRSSYYPVHSGEQDYVHPGEAGNFVLKVWVPKIRGRFGGCQNPPMSGRLLVTSPDHGSVLVKLSFRFSRESQSFIDTGDIVVLLNPLLSAESPRDESPVQDIRDTQSAGQIRW